MFLRTRRGGNARLFIDPLGWRVYGWIWPVSWLQRKFRMGSRPSWWLQKAEQFLLNWQFQRRLRKYDFGSDDD